jgi:succinoglycan biosynthesis transport protein ExoP
VAQQDRGVLELLDALRWRWGLAVLIALGVVVGATLYVEALPAEYRTESVVALAPRAGTDAGSDTVRLVAPKYVAFLEAPETIQRVAVALGTVPDTIEDSIEAVVQTDSGNLTVSATSENPRLAAEIANTMAGEATTFAQDDELLSAEIVARALVRTDPSGPPRLLLEAAALLVGVLAGVSIALLVERGRPRIRSWRDISELTGFTTLTRIPRSRIVRYRPLEAFSDPEVGSAFRTLRTNLERLTADIEEVPIKRVIQITSAVKGGGKTTVAALFAESLARLGKKTLLVDADLARAGLTPVFELEPQDEGMAALLRGETTLGRTVLQGWVDNLYVLPTTPYPDAGDILAQRLEPVLEQMLSGFEQIVIDSPPVIGTDESRTIATQVGGVILVVRGGEMAGPVHEAVLALEDLKAPVIGAVANRMRRADIGQPYR